MRRKNPDFYADTPAELRQWLLRKVQTGVSGKFTVYVRYTEGITVIRNVFEDLNEGFINSDTPDVFIDAYHIRVLAIASTVQISINIRERGIIDL